MPLVKGALIEYPRDAMGSIPNAVIFQFNPEQLDRTITAPLRTTGKESDKAGTSPTEQIKFTAVFNAADQLNNDNPIARLFGIGPQLAALESMAYPKEEKNIQALKTSLDAFGDLLSGKTPDPGTAIPRPEYPPILFIWGITRVLPVVLRNLTITEKQYDRVLNPIRAEVTINLEVQPVRSVQSDIIAIGAHLYTNLAKSAQAAANLAQTVADLAASLGAPVEEIIPF